MSFYTTESVLRLMADCIQYHQPLEDLMVVLNTGVDINKPVHKGLRALHYAAYENALEIAKLLIEKGAKVNRADEVGYTPLHIASKYGHTDIAKLFIENGAVVNFFGGNLSGSQAYFLSDSSALADLTVNPLNLALENGHADTADLLLRHGSDPNHQYFIGHEINLIPLEHLDCIEILLRHGAFPDVCNKAGFSLMHKAAKMGAPQVISILATYGSDVNHSDCCKAEQKRAVHYAVLANRIDSLEQLLQCGADIRKPPNFPLAPLAYAVQLDRPEHCNLLLQYGADPNELGEDFCSPLQVACTTPGLLHQKEILTILLTNGADPNYARETHSFHSPSLAPIVEYIAYNSAYDPSIIRLLLMHGAEVMMAKPTRKFDIICKAGILAQVRKFKKDAPTLSLLIEACSQFVRDDIDFDHSGMAPDQRMQLLQEAECPRSLAHMARIKIRRLIKPPKLVKIQSLPVPLFFRNFLTYNYFGESIQ